MKQAKYIVIHAFFITAVILAYYILFRGKVSMNDIPKKYSEKILSDKDLSLMNCFQEKQISFPPDEIHLLAFKNEKILEVWSKNNDEMALVKTFAFAGFSGESGPKLREGDKQIPEGIYRIVNLNPNSSYHLSMLLNYPNEFDIEKARIEGRENPGSDICIHGGFRTIGCIPVGNDAIEEIYYLVEELGINDVVVKIFPNDARISGDFIICEECPSWIDELYSILKIELEQYK